MYRNEYYLEKTLQHQQAKLQQVNIHQQVGARNNQTSLTTRLGEWMVKVGTNLQSREAQYGKVTRSRVGA